MSQPFTEAFARAHRAAETSFNAGDFEAAFAGLAPDVAWSMHPSLLESGTVRGRDAVIRYFRGVREGVDWRVEAQEFIDAGDGRVVVHQRGTATGRTTGISDDRDFFQLWEVGRDGLATRVREFETREEALQAARLQE
jgi:ketosteroid isomerase-like protein